MKKNFHFREGNFSFLGRKFSIPRTQKPNCVNRLVDLCVAVVENENPCQSAFSEMNPFSIFLRNARLGRGLRQSQLAARLGYEQSYISALERGVKGPPRRDFVERLIRHLALDEAEQAQLKEAIAASRRHFSLPRCASEVELQLVHQLAPRLGRLTPLQIQLIELALAIPEGASLHQVSTCSFGRGRGMT